MKAKPPPLPFIEYVPVDWPQLIDKLAATGLTLARIADAANLPKSTLMAYRTPGKQPSHCIGERLLVVWDQHMSRPEPRVGEP